LDKDTTNTTTTAVKDVPKVIGALSVTYPTLNSQFALGEIITITWLSNRSINDVVKIELMKGSDVALLINSRTSNDGAYEWTIPTTLSVGNYSIKITWLSTEPTPPTAESDLFTLLFSTTTTTTTTTAPKPTVIPDISSCRGIPLLELQNDEYVSGIFNDATFGGVLFATSDGRILGCSTATVNGYLTGDRNVYAETKDNYGNVSDTATLNVVYGLYNKIAEVNSSNEIVQWKFQKQASAILLDRITGIFMSPILSVKQDLILWKSLIWQETKPDNTEIIICIRSANSERELMNETWDHCFVSNESDIDAYITRDLDDIESMGKYIQFRITMTTDARSVSPSILNVSIAYSTKFATYFFTTKFSLKNNSNMRKGLFTGEITQPQNTEIKFGITGNNSSDWNDYTVVGMNRFFKLNKLDNVKLGIKMISYDDHIPEVSEFALMTASEVDNSINII
jgi:hypothetical protein